MYLLITNCFRTHLECDACSVTVETDRQDRIRPFLSSFSAAIAILILIVV